LRTAAWPQFLFSIKMSSSPQIDPSDLDPDLSSGTAPWKDEVADRLAAHRLRRDRRAPLSDSQSALFTPAVDDPNRAARIAAAIADRYARQPSYRDVLAAQEEAEHQRLADEEARATAAAAALAAAQQPAPEEAAAPEPKHDLDHRRRYIETSHRVVLHAPMPAPMPQQMPSRAAAAQDEDAKEAVARAIARAEAEDLFNAVLVEPTVPLPAKLIEFPRELIAPRKARPRLAEGPLQQAASVSAGDSASQLRIFEVETEAISHQPPPPAVDSVSNAPNWSNIRLDDNQGPRWEFETPAASPFALPLHPAALSRRVLATAVDFACVAGAFAGFAAVFFFSTTHPPMTKLGAEFGGGIFVLLFALYQWMFFTYAESTPGMRAARIALCTFDDTNPTRRAMRLRLGAVLLAACPFGLGFLWAIVDEDGLGWHDRIARMYQRSY
jgi:uncharacterized RDD family membrane protein YckC